MAANPIKIVMADDHKLVTGGIVAQLQQVDDFEICEIVHDGHQAVMACTRCRPDIVLLNIGLPIMNGIEAAKAIKRTLPQTKIITITGTERHHEILEMIEAGAAACIYKGMETDLVEAIRQVRDGYVLLPAFVFDAYRSLNSPRRRRKPHKRYFCDGFHRARAGHFTRTGAGLYQ